MRLASFVCVLTVAVSLPKSDCSDGGSANKPAAPTITILGLFPLTGNAHDPSSGVQLPNGSFLEAAASFALANVAEKNVLTGYSLQLRAEDTACKREDAVWQISQLAFAQLPNEPYVVLGPACEESALLTAGIASGHLNTVLVSYSASSTLLTNVTRYPNFFRTVPSYSDYDRAMFTILEHLSWRKFCVVAGGDHYYFEAVERIASLSLKSHNASLLQLVLWNNVQYLSDTSCRIFMVMVSDEIIPQVMCDAHRANIVGPAFEWILFGEAHEEELFDSTFTSCTSSQLQDAMQYALLGTFQPEPSGHVQARSISGLDRDSFVEEYGNYLRLKNLSVAQLMDIDPDFHFPIAVFDAVWTIAVGLNTSESLLQRQGLSLVNYCTDCDGEVAANVTSSFEAVNFVGVSGQITFSPESHSPEPVIEVYQVQNGKLVPITLYDPFENIHDWNYYGNELMWEDGSPPLDSPKEDLSYPPRFFEAIMMAVAVTGIAVSIFFFVINMYYRKSKPIKASSPPMNNAIILGCVIGFVSVILFSIDPGYIPAEAFFYICNIHPWLVSFSFTLSFGTLFSKTWRVYAIFRNPWSKRRFYRNSTLYAFVAVMLLMDVALLIPQATVDPMSLYNETIVTPSVVTIIPYCRSESNLFFLWIGLLLVYKGLLLLLGVFLALKIRKIEFKAYNDSKTIGRSVYGVVVTAGFGVPVAFFTMFSGRIAVSYIITAITINACAFVILLFVFVPKIQLLRANRREKKQPKRTVFLSASSSTLNTLSKPLLFTESTTFSSSP